MRTVSAAEVINAIATRVTLARTARLVRLPPEPILGTARTNARIGLRFLPCKIRVGDKAVKNRAGGTGKFADITGNAEYSVIPGPPIKSDDPRDRRVVAFYNQRGTAEQWIKEGKNAVTWTRLSCYSFKANAVWPQLHGLAYNLANFLRTLALPAEVAQWPLSALRDWLVRIGA